MTDSTNNKLLSLVASAIRDSGDSIERESRRNYRVMFYFLLLELGLGATVGFLTLRLVVVCFCVVGFFVVLVVGELVLLVVGEATGELD